jgi:hypothetical protein
VSDYPNEAGSKGGGASAEAAERLDKSGKRATLRAKVLALFRLRDDWAPDEAALHLGEHPLDIRPRFSELSVGDERTIPTLEKTDGRRLTWRGNSQHVYRRVRIIP